jgi:hypothetical protein
MLSNIFSEELFKWPACVLLERPEAEDAEDIITVN